MPRGRVPTCLCGSCAKCKRRGYQREYQRKWALANPLTEEQKQVKRERTKAWLKANPERAKENGRRYQQTEHYREYQKKWREENREAFNAQQLAYYHALDDEGKKKWSARSALNEAKSKGKITAEPCLFCDEADAHAHHHDYDRPLEVTWLCRRHHALVHVTERQGMIT